MNARTEPGQPLKKGIKTTSLVRSVKKQKKLKKHETTPGNVGTFSYHITGRAVDIAPVNTDRVELHALIMELMKKGKIVKGGIGIYKKDNHIHYDTRGWIEKFGDGDEARKKAEQLINQEEPPPNTSQSDISFKNLNTEYEIKIKTILALRLQDPFKEPEGFIEKKEGKESFEEMYETQGWDSLYFNLKQTLLSEGSSYLPQAKTNFENLKSYVLNDIESIIKVSSLDYNMKQRKVAGGAAYRGKKRDIYQVDDDFYGKALRSNKTQLVKSMIRDVRDSFEKDLLFDFVPFLCLNSYIEGSYWPEFGILMIRPNYYEQSNLARNTLVKVITQNTSRSPVASVGDRAKSFAMAFGSWAYAGQIGDKDLQGKPKDPTAGDKRKKQVLEQDLPGSYLTRGTLNGVEQYMNYHIKFLKAYVKVLEDQRGGPAPTKILDTCIIMVNNYVNNLEKLVKVIPNLGLKIQGGPQTALETMEALLTSGGYISSAQKTLYYRINL